MMRTSGCAAGGIVRDTTTTDIPEKGPPLAIASPCFERLAAHHEGIELGEEGGEIEIGIHDNPVRLTVGPGDIAIQAHGHLIAHSSHT